MSILLVEKVRDPVRDLARELMLSPRIGSRDP
jgi:hypothetical protein